MRRQADTEQKILSFVQDRHLLPKGSMVCVCFSGGLDSTVLLHIIHQHREELGISLSACHFNHSIRGKEADRDEDFCRTVCERLSVPFYCGRADVPALQKNSGKSIEEVARDVRYGWFDALQKEERIDLFVTAHHKNDQAETVLFRAIRGTTVAGLAGIPVKRGSFVRPLLCVSREELQRYAEETDIEYVVDSTNQTMAYARNRLRGEVLPTLALANPGVVDALDYLSQCAAEDQAFILSFLPEYREMQTVSDLPDALLRRTVARNYTVFSGKTLCRTHLNAICQAVQSGGDHIIGLKDRHRAVLKNGCLHFEGCPPEKHLSIPFAQLHEGVTLLCGGAIRITLGADTWLRAEPDGEFVYNLSTEFSLSFGGICGMISYRSRQAGDRLLLHGVNRSAKKLVSEQKIPLYLRSVLPVICDAKGILCIPFVAIADRAREKQAEDVIRLRVEIDEYAVKKG